MLKTLHSRGGMQLVIGLAVGVAFGFLLQKGGVGNYDIIINQLLLRDFTVLKIMVSAIITGMIGIHLMRSLGWVSLHPKPGSVGTSIVGGLIFGVGFAVLGYCPGIVGVAAAQGGMDALIGGVLGILCGVWLFAVLYPRLNRTILQRGDFGEATLPQVLRLHQWLVVPIVAAALISLLWWLESMGL